MTVQTIATLKTNMPIGVAGGTTVSDIHDIVDTLEDRTSQEVITKTANYTAVLTDNRRRLVFNAASGVTFTIPNSVPVGWEVIILQIGAGQVTVAVTDGTLLHRSSHTKLAGTGSMAHLFCYANAGTAPQVAFFGDTAV
jgi:hypothetical protein